MACIQVEDPTTGVVVVSKLVVEEASDVQPEAAEASEQHAKGELPQRMYQRDMFQTPFSETSVQAAALAQNIECFVASKMTAFPSVTDTDVAMSFKAALRRSKQKLSSDIRLAMS